MNLAVLFETQSIHTRGDLREFDARRVLLALMALLEDLDDGQYLVEFTP